MGRVSGALAGAALGADSTAALRVLQKAPICKGSCRLLATPNNFQPTSLACATPAEPLPGAGAELDAGLLLRHSSGRYQAPRAALRGAAADALSACWRRHWEASAPAKTPQEKLDATQGKLEHVRESQSSLAETIAEQNAAIDSMIGEVSALRQKQAAVEAELAEKEEELDARDRRPGQGTRAPRRGPRPAEARPRRPARAPGGDLRGRLAERRQRDPRIRATGRRWRPRPNT